MCCLPNISDSTKGRRRNFDREQDIWVPVPDLLKPILIQYNSCALKILSRLSPIGKRNLLVFGSLKAYFLAMRHDHQVC